MQISGSGPKRQLPEPEGALNTRNALLARFNPFNCDDQNVWGGDGGFTKFYRHKVDGCGRLSLANVPSNALVCIIEFMRYWSMHLLLFTNIEILSHMRQEECIFGEREWETDGRRVGGPRILAL